jgi:2-keto-4-pentenoate hydratase/2-oxohepta-3-ene-1,7-dioic acid hydratase in catechol pathway
MRLASVIEEGAWTDVVVREDRYLPLTAAAPSLRSVRRIAATGPDGPRSVAAWVEAQPGRAWRPLEAFEEIGPPILPGAIYTIGQNYRPVDAAADHRLPRPLVYGKAVNSISGHHGIVAWDRSLTANVDAECELGVVIGKVAWQVDPARALGHVFGFTVVNDISSRDPWLDGDQWLLGKSMNGFCPIGPWIVTADELAPDALRLGCSINGEPIQDGTTADMWFGVAEVVSYLSRHVTLSPGDLIAMGTPARLDGPPGPERHLQPTDVVTAWIEQIGELTTTIG